MKFDPRTVNPVLLALLSGGVLMLDEQSYAHALSTALGGVDGERSTYRAFRPMAAMAGAERGDEVDRLYQRVGSVAIVDIWGILDKTDADVTYEGWFGSYRFGTSYDFIRRATAAAVADDAVKSVLLRINSPGGAAMSVEPAAASIFGVRPSSDGKVGGKPVVAYADDMAASAAFYIASQAMHVYGSPGSWLGSIGVIVHTMDRSKMLADWGITVNTIKSVESKDAGSPFRPMSEQDRALIQKDVDEYDRQFVAAVMRGRGVDEAKVRAWAKQRGFIGQRAVEAGLADGVRATVEAVVAEMNDKWGGGSGAAGLAGRGALGGRGVKAATPQNRSEEMAARDTKDGADVGAGDGKTPVADATPPTAKADTVVIAVDRAAVLAEDQNRRNAIRQRAFAFSGNADIDALRLKAEDGGWSAEKFSDEAVKALAAKAPQTGHVSTPAAAAISVGAEGSKKFAAGLMVSLIDRMRPDLTAAIDGSKGKRVAAALGFDSPELADKAIRTAKAEGLFGMGIQEIAIRCAAATGIGLDAAHRLFRGSDGGIRFMAALSHSSSDFTHLMSNVANKTLQATYESQDVIWRDIARKGVSTDYKERSIIATSKLTKPELLPEGQTPKLVSFGERKEAIVVEPYGSKFGFSYQTLRNDDLGAFSMKLNALSESFVEIPDDLLLALLALNSGLGPTMSDGSTLFHANHNNITTQAALSYAALQLDFIAFEKQKDFNPEVPAASRRYISVKPQTLLVPTDLRFTAEDLAMQPNVPGAAASPSSATQRNVLAGRFKPVATPKLSGTRRYLFGPTGMHATLEVAFLDGNESAQVVELPMTNPMEMQWQATMPGVGVSAVNWETAVTNAG